LATDKPSGNLDKFATDLGKAFAIYRNQNKISQKIPQLWGKAKGVPLHDSQLAYFEKGQLEPKRQFWVSLEMFNMAVANNKFPPTDKIFTKTIKDKLKDAEPFFNIDNKPATALDFFAMAIGKQEINNKYLNINISPELAAKYISQLVKTFNDVARNNMMSNKEAWEEILKTKSIKKLSSEDIKVFQDILRGEYVPTVTQIQDYKKKYGSLTCYDALKEWSGKVPTSLERTYKEVML
tara:strand:+ start:214 stop:924 length:711 start_codon:yes stop_codon:yes gene_type:complete